MKRRAACVAALAAAGCAIGIALCRPAVPGFDAVRARWRPSDAQLLDRRGEPIHELRVDAHGRRLAWTPLADISPALQEAVVTSEDRRFQSHHGVDFAALAGSVARRLAGRRGRGASTLTMQVAAMLDPRIARAAMRRRTAMQKLRQMLAALALERRWSKAQILEAYLNLVTYRGEIEGVGAAARVMFGKAPDGIDAAEAVVLAALIRAPNARAAALGRRAEALRLAMDRRDPSREVSSAEISSAIDRALAARASDFTRVTLAPRVAEQLLRNGRLTAQSTLDRDLQGFALDALRRHVAEVHERNVDDGAVVVVENSTGEVWAYVGGTGALSSAPYVDGVRAMRQPGSALKPFLYALALERRLLTPASLLEDTPLELPEQRGLYRPLDYDREFRGLVSMRVALASSLNVPAVRTIGMVGVEAFTGQLRMLGFEGIVEQGDYYGAALALGSADVRLWDLVNAYRTLANGGRYSRDAPFTRRRAGARAANLLASDRVSDFRHPRRSREPRCHVRPGEFARDALLECRQNRHQQGHARQLVRRLHRPLYGWRMGRKFLRRLDARRDRHHRCGAGMARRDELSRPALRRWRDREAGRRDGADGRVSQRGRTRARRMVPRGHRAESPGGASQRHAANSLAGAGHRDRL